MRGDHPIESTLMPTNDKLLADAVAAGIANFEATRGSVSDSFKLLLEHSPATFAGYGLMRANLMKDGALDLKTKELIFALLDTVIGETNGAKAHAANAIRLGLTVEQLTEGLVQCVMAAGITTWNMTGQHTLRHAIEVRDEMTKAKSR